jgi:anti-sigma-K factor RskA
MELQSFISSGLLESYALGQCSAAERQLVEQMLTEHPSVQIELNAIEQALEQYAQFQAITPPPGLKNKILDAIQETQENEIEKPELEVTMPKGRSLNPWVLGLCAAALIFSAYLWVSYQQVKQKHQELQEKVEQLKTELQACGNRAANSMQFANLVRDPNTKRIEILGEKDIHFTVFNSDAQHSVVLDLADLPAPKPGKYFQFWAIIDGKPVSMGMISSGADDKQQTFAYLENVQAFAISEEDKPQGNATPTVVLAVGKTS